MNHIAAQAVGILGAALGIISFQFKDNKKYYAAQALSGLCFAVSFFLLGAYTGALLNLINVGRGFGFAAEKSKKPNITFISVSALYLAATVFTFNGALSVLVCTAQFVSSYAMWSRNNTRMKVLQFVFASPAWLVYNAFTGSLGGLLCESFNMVSVAVYFIRTRFISKTV